MPTTPMPTTSIPTASPSADPTSDPFIVPTADNTRSPSADPTSDPFIVPTADNTLNPSADPTSDPFIIPTADNTLSPTEDPTIGCPATYPNRVFLSFNVTLTCDLCDLFSNICQTSLQTASNTALLATINTFVAGPGNTCYNVEFTIFCENTVRRLIRIPSVPSIQNDDESYQVLIELTFADIVDIQSAILDGSFATTFYNILLQLLDSTGLINLTGNPLSVIDIFGLCSTEINSYFIYPCVERNYVDSNKYCRENYGTKLATISDDTATRDAAIDLIGDETVWFGLRTKDNKQWRFLEKSDQCTNTQTHYKCIDFWQFRLNQNANYRPRCVGSEKENGEACAYFDGDLNVANNDVSCDEEMQFLCNAP